MKENHTVLFLSLILALVAGCKSDPITNKQGIQEPNWTLPVTPERNTNKSDASLNYTLRTVAQLTNGYAEILKYRPRSDLRLLFEAKENIENMKKSGCCLVQYKVGTRVISSKPNIGGIVTLRKVLELAYPNYDGQVRVISRDSIIQTPIWTYGPEMQLQINVIPGDLVYILGRVN